jgi:hypothetical protein
LFKVQEQTIRDTIIINQANMEAKTEATQREFQSQLEEVEARAEHGRTVTGASAAQPPQFDGTVIHHGPCTSVNSRP